MGRTYRFNKDGENDKYKKEKYLQEQKKRQKRKIEEDAKFEKQEKKGHKREHFDED